MKPNPAQAEGPRLLDLRQAETYSGLSYWTLRDLALAGKIARVLIPDARVPGRYLRRILFSKQALDAFIAGCESKSSLKVLGTKETGK